MSLRPYIAFVGDAGEGAWPVFAHTAREARRIGYRGISGYLDADYVDIRARRLRATWWIMRLAESSDEPHMVDPPPACRSCELWGDEPLRPCGLCWDCETQRIEASIPRPWLREGPTSPKHGRERPDKRGRVIVTLAPGQPYRNSAG